MRKTYPHNPRGLERSSWGYRCLQLRHALGWSQTKLAGVMGIRRYAVSDIEAGTTTRPNITTVRAIRNLESAYADILKAYKRAPIRMNRLRVIRGGSPSYGGRRKGGVNLLPIKVRRPEDIETLGAVESDSQPIYFGRASRKRMQQTGMSERRVKRNKAIAQGIRRAMLKRRGEPESSKEVQSGQPPDIGVRKR